MGEIVSNNVRDKYISIVTDISLCKDISLPRSLNLDHDVNICEFCDASTKAYGTVVYIKSVSNIKFVISKARVVPVKPSNLPQLELTAANLVARLVSYVKHAFVPLVKRFNVHVWSNSQIALARLKKAKVSKQYVQQRLDNIAQLILEATWHYVCSADNPADALSRGIMASDFIGNSLWFNEQLVLRATILKLCQVHYRLNRHPLKILWP